MTVKNDTLVHIPKLNDNKDILCLHRLLESVPTLFLHLSELKTLARIFSKDSWHETLIEL